MASLYDRISKGKMQVSEITESMEAATSEGGKFFQSMEKQSKTLNGQLSTLKDNANQFLATLTEGMTDELRTELLPLANNIIAELQGAFDAGGVDGLIDAASNMIPDLLGMMTGKLEDAISGITRWLPEGAEKIIQAFPDMLQSASSAIPKITTALFGIASTVVENLITMLPELVPILAEAIGKTALAALTGVGKLIGGVFDGVEAALKDIGLLAPEAHEVLQGLIDDVDQVDINDLNKKLDVDITTEVTPDDYQSKIDTAISEIETALKNVPGLSDNDREAIKQAFIKGCGMDALQVAFDELNIDSTAATSAITTAQGNINTVLSDLGLSEEAKAHIQGLISNNADAGEIQKALESFGVDAGVAGAAATSITTEMNTLSETLSTLGVPESAISSMLSGLMSDKMQIVAALQMLGLSETQIDAVLASYDTVAGSLTAGVKGIYKNIADMFTDGVPESDADVQAAKTSIEGIATEAQERLDKWYADKVKELESSGLSGAALDAELANTKALYDELSSGIESNTTTMLNQTESMVGQSTEYCKGQVKIMGETVDALEELYAQVDILTSADVSRAEMSRKITMSGATQDQATQLEAIQLTYKEYMDKMRKAEEEYATEIEKAREQYEKDGDLAAYQDAERRTKAKLSDAQRLAAEYYQAYMDQIIAGIMQSNPEVARAMQKAVDRQGLAMMFDGLRGEIQKALASNTAGETNLTLEDILGKFSIDESQMEQFASALGLDADMLYTYLNNELLGGDLGFLSMFGQNLHNEANQMMADALSGEGIDLSSQATVLAAAIQNGWLLPGINGVDYTNAEALINAGIDGMDINPKLNISEAFEDSVDESDFSSVGDTVQEKVEAAFDDDGIQDLPEEKFKQMFDVDSADMDFDPQKTAEQLQIGQKAEELNNAIITAFNANQLSENPLSLTDILGNLSMGDDDLASIADAMGLTPEALLNQLNSTLKTGDTTFGANVSSLITGMFDGVDLSGVNEVGENIGAGVGEGLSDHDFSGDAESAVGAIEGGLRTAAQSHSPAARFVPVGSDIAAGVAQGISEYDASGAAGGLVGGIADAITDEKPNVQKAGESLASGAAIGIATRAYVAVNAAAAMARAVVAKIRSVFDSHSPSRVAIAIGNDFGDGMSIGLREGLTRAVNVAQRMSGEIVTAASLPNMSYLRNMPDIASEITVANEQSATPVLLDGKQIAEIQGHNNSSVIAWRNTKAAKGVGSR